MRFRALIPAAALILSMTLTFAQAADVTDEVNLAMEEQKLAMEAQKQAMEELKQAMEEEKEALKQAGIKLKQSGVFLPGHESLPAGSGWPFGNQGSILVLPEEDAPANTIAELKKDLRIMLEIFTKNLDKAEMKAGNFLSRQRPQGIYLGDYGALFLLQVKFPLEPAGAVSEEEPEEDIDQVWKETEEEVFTDRRISTTISRSLVFVDNMLQAEPEEEYSAEKVEALKKVLISSLKHAANIRHLESENQLLIAIPSITNPERVLILRASKEDIDDFAQEKLTYEEFAQQVEIKLY